jgi:hypothetical protein
VSGDGIIDYFFLSDALGAREILPTVRQLAEQNGYEVALSFDHTGAADLGKTDDLWKELSKAPTQQRPGEAPKKEFRPKVTGDSTPNAAAIVPVEQTQAQAASALRNLLGQAERVMRGGRKMLVVFREPEELWHGAVGR